MSIALAGFLTGFAKGAKERVDKEREENEALIQNRLKSAQANRLLFKKEQEAQRQLLQGRLETVSPYLPENATELQKMALIGNEEMTKQFVEYVNNSPKGKPVDLDNFIIINKDKVPQNFTSVQDYLKNISAAPTPVSQEQIDAIRQTEGFFGARVGPNVEKMAQQYGMSANQLLAYEDATVSTDFPQFARINIDATKKPKSFEDRIKELEAAGLAAAEANDTVGFENTKNLIKDLKEKQQTLTPEQLTWAEEMSRAKLAAANATTAQERSAAERRVAQLQRIDDIGKKSGEDKAVTESNLRSNVKIAIANDIRETFGERLKEGWKVGEGLDGIPTYQYVGQDAAINKEITKITRNAVKRALGVYINRDGTPMNAATRNVMVAYNINFSSPETNANPSGVDESNPLLR